MKTKWSHVPGTLARELYLDSKARLCDAADDRLLPVQLRNAVLDANPIAAQCPIELVIDFESSGYYEPMSMYGGPDNLGWPEEGDEDRSVTGMKVLVGCMRVPLCSELRDELASLYQGEIERAEIETEADA